ncbi:polysaccharide biosynthesis tyrosine autokinase [Ferrimonas pelagia]|uniref:non-specific protein-tyrosine kinase n=1 Tax=Ferrimonas pelagia TaxID=1177826 RepID=A0ABP9EZA7_9GAMM
MSREFETQKEQMLSMEWVGFSAQWAVLRRYRGWIVLFTLLIAAIGFAVIRQMPPQYYSEALLLLENRQSSVVSIEEIYGLDASSDEYFQTQYQIIQSRKIAEDVIERTGLLSEREFIASSGWGIGLLRNWLSAYIPYLRTEQVVLSEEQKAYRLLKRVLGRYYERLTVVPIRNTQLVTIRFYAQDPELAARVANAIGRSYIESYMEDKLVATQEATGWMRGRLETLKKNLRNSELTLQQFRDDAGLVDVEGLLTLEGKELEGISARLNEAKARRSAAQTVARSVSGNAGNLKQLAGLPEINRHPSVQQLRSAESAAEQKVAQLANRYGPKHKAMIAAKAELSEVQSSLRRQIRELVDGIQQEYQAASREETSMLAELEAAKKNYQGLSKNETEYRELLREVETNRQLYDTFLTRIKETGVAGDFNEAIARFTDPATPALTPAKPQRGMLLAAAVLAALMSAVIVALLYARWADVINRADEVESQLKAKLLGIVPQMKFSSSQVAAKGYFDEKHPEFGESWRSIRTTLTLHEGMQLPSTLAITSATPEEGKTTSAISLALALQQVKKVLLIDCDLRRPSVAKAFKIAEYEPGLTNALSGTHTLEQCVYEEPDSGLSILSAGNALSQPLEALSGDAFEKLLERARSRYDVVIMDTPPVNAVSDALVVGRHAGAMAFIVRANFTRVKLAQRALDQILANKILVSGVILNRAAKEAMQAQYGKSYESYYGHGYHGANRPSEKQGTAA